MDNNLIFVGFRLAMFQIDADAYGRPIVAE
jgi:hypothetical protein